MLIIKAIPSPEINSFQLGPLTIHIYAICIISGIILALGLLNKLVKKYNSRLIDFSALLEMVCWIIPISIIGARLFHCVTLPDNYFSSPEKFINIFKIWQGGLGIMGGVLFGVATAYIFCRIKKIAFFPLLDLAAPCILFAQAVGRFGNYFNRELYGFPTNLPWGLKVDSSGVLYHPTFLYEAIWNCLGAAISLYIIYKNYIFENYSKKISPKNIGFKNNILKQGAIFNLYIIWYCLGRTFIELIRIDPSYQIFGWRLNSFIAFVICVLAIGVFLYRMISRRNS
ncbi:MAG: prolipoprotein diacylglyceryl transferase [Bifidobacteriaceae bacterium]|jgi:prolipoprotein diacylglyceryl transferase|nr:prolipoprotein diacylglyceryl transferase [Bifidobacteriaceae bacterium]